MLKKGLTSYGVAKIIIVKIPKMHKFATIIAVKLI